MAQNCTRPITSLYLFDNLCATFSIKRSLHKWPPVQWMIFQGRVLEREEFDDLLSGQFHGAMETSS